MAQYETIGKRYSLGADGKVQVQIPVSVTDDTVVTPPTAPTGTKLVSAEYTLRADGGRDYTLVYESGGSSSQKAQIQVQGQASQEPVETHPKFNGASGYGTITDADLAAIKASLNDGSTPGFTGTGLNLTAAQDLYKLMLKGVTSYYTPSGITYSETTDETTKPSLADLCKVQTAPTDAPTLATNQNWLFFSIRAEKIYDPITGTPIWRTSKEWIASGPRGWNADFALYET
jgi:hypothetical protein